MKNYLYLTSVFLNGLAMSMELPAIATNWSGNTEFMKPTNSFLIKVKELVNAPEEGHQWAQPDKADLQVHLRFVYESRGDAKKIGKKARQDVVTEFSQSAVKDKIVTRLRELQPHLPEHRARRAANPVRHRHPPPSCPILCSHSIFLIGYRETHGALATVPTQPQTQTPTSIPILGSHGTTTQMVPRHLKTHKAVLVLKSESTMRSQVKMSSL
jgi:hypothetical protein